MERRMEGLERAVVRTGGQVWAGGRPGGDLDRGATGPEV